VFRAITIISNKTDLLADIRELYSRRPETKYREAWELQHLLFSLGYVDGLVPEAEIVAAMEVARGDWMPEEATA
jgi:hypothetical protein